MDTWYNVTLYTCTVYGYLVQCYIVHLNGLWILGTMLHCTLERFLDTWYNVTLYT